MGEPMNQYMLYEHHGQRVWVREDLLGLHRDHCLCNSCGKFKPDTPDNCPIAALLYRVCVLAGLTTPVWECPEFEAVDPTALRHLPGRLINDAGPPDCCVYFERPNRTQAHEWKGTVGGFLCIPDHFGGTWHIDAGQGGPPGPMVVEWDNVEHCWEYQGCK